MLTDDGYFNDEAGPEFAGLKLGPGQEKVMERLAEVGALLAREEIHPLLPARLALARPAGAAGDRRSGS